MDLNPVVGIPLSCPAHPHGRGGGPSACSLAKLRRVWGVGGGRRHCATRGMSGRCNGSVACSCVGCDNSGPTGHKGMALKGPHSVLEGLKGGNGRSTGECAPPPPLFPMCPATGMTDPPSGREVHCCESSAPMTPHLKCRPSSYAMRSRSIPRPPNWTSPTPQDTP